jgi:NAD-dependent protein deacetylase SIR2
MVRQLSEMTKEAKPTPFHHMLAKLASEDRLLRLYTQNVDGLDTSMEPLGTNVPLNRKGPWPKTVQLHGGLQKMVCSKCNELSDLQADLFDGPTPPLCEQCVATDNARTEHAGKRSHGVGRLRPRMVLYNEHNPDDEAIGAVMKADLRTRPDALIVVGTTLKIPGVKRIVKEMCGVVRGRRDGLTVWMNMDEPPVSKDFEWDLIVRGPCDRVAQEASTHIWEIPRSESVSTEEAEKIASSQTVEVQVPATPKKLVAKMREAEKSMPTPQSSRSSSTLPPATVQSKPVPLLLKNSLAKTGPKATGPKDAQKPKVKRATKPKAPPGTKRGKKVSVVPANAQLVFSLSKGDSETAIGKKRKPMDPSGPLSPADSSEKENTVQPLEIKIHPRSSRPSSPASDIKPPLSPVSDSSMGGASKASLGFILN